MKTILCDCKEEEVKDLQRGIFEETGDLYTIESTVSNGLRTSVFSEIRRYFLFFYAPLKAFLHRGDYEVIVGWQQFYALIFCWYEMIFHTKHRTKVVVLNFTYKGRKGVKGWIYDKFMRSIVTSSYVDFIHVPSYEYADYCNKVLNIDRDKIAVFPFGVPDFYERYKDEKVEYEDYVLAIGRSNRDYNWLIGEWKNVKSKLLLVSDSFVPGETLPDNVIHRTDIGGETQFPYIMNCKSMILPIDNGKMCSGDTVLLTAMSYKKMVVITKPSTLSEMYIEDGVDGVVVEKIEGVLSELFDDNREKRERLGEKAREKYCLNFSRVQMGRNCGKILNK